MPLTPDRRPGPLEEDEEIRLLPNTDAPTQPGALNYDGSQFLMRDALGTFNPRSMTEQEHQDLYTLVHDIDQSSYDEVLRTSGLISQVITWDSALKTRKIREVIATRTGNVISRLETRQYDALGVLKEVLVEDVQRGFNNSILSVIRTR